LTDHEFQAAFSRPPTVIADAPGRVNLIGEHTDYNGGYVLPMAIPQRTRVELAERTDDVVRLCSANLKESPTYHLGSEHKMKAWFDYVQGVTQALRESGYTLQGFDARIDSRVPIGRGLSSSAALEVAMLRALRQAFHLELDDVALALLAQRGENELVGAPVGVMDPLASSLADEHTAVFIDTRSLRIERIPLPRDVEIAIIDSGISHANVGSGYALRRQECAMAAKLLGVPQLRDAYALDRIEQLPEPLHKRARHVVTENARVLAAVDAMRANDPVALGGLFVESHVSMRDDFEVSVPEVDAIVERALRDPAVYGARLTGGGFGGAVVVLTRAGEGRAAAERISRDCAGSTVVLP
jgi:galactokinase